ncbi:MAG: N-acetylmuramoyl-L-alanine amidase [Clostridiales bacterium]|nr:N-acetylmuramoyl-L-alanine amidase [Clostridiales bacterium]
MRKCIKRCKAFLLAVAIALSLVCVPTQTAQASETTTLGNLTIHQNLQTVNASSRYGKSIQYIVIHYTASTGTAYNNTVYFQSYRGSSAHYFVDYSGAIWQSTADSLAAWSVGGSKYANTDGGTYYKIATNYNTLNIEMCVRTLESKTSTTTDWYFEDNTITATVELVQALMDKYDIDIDHVIRHYDVTGKTCPNPFVLNDDDVTWDDFLQMVAGTMATPGAEDEEDTSEAVISGSSGSTSDSTTSSSSTSDTGSSSGSTVTFTVGQTYTVTASDLYVRKGPGPGYSKVGDSGLTSNAKANDKDKDGGLDQGTRVTCLETATVGDDIWMRIPSGWIAAYYNGKYYVSGGTTTSTGTSSSSSSGSSAGSSVSVSYTVGQTYTLQVDRLNVRKSASDTAAKVSYSGLTSNAKKNAYSNGQLKKGTKVTCKAVKVVGSDVWIQIPSGWIAAYYNGQYYVK